MGFTVYQYAEICTFVLSLFCIRRLHRSFYLWVIPYLAIVVYIDIISRFFPIMIRGSNHWQFNIYLPIQYLFFAYIFFKSLQSKIYKSIIFAGNILFAIFFLVNICFYQGLFEFNNQTFLLTCFLLILYSCLTLLELLKKETKQPIFKQYIFWVAISCLIFFVGFSVLFSVYFFYKSSPASYIRHKNLYSIIANTSNIFHYLFLCISIFIFSIHKK